MSSEFAAIVSSFMRLYRSLAQTVLSSKYSSKPAFCLTAGRLEGLVKLGRLQIGNVVDLVVELSKSGREGGSEVARFYWNANCFRACQDMRQ